MRLFGRICSKLGRLVSIAIRIGAHGAAKPAATYQEVVVTDIPYRTALIVGAGPGISASVARGLASAGLKVGLAARNVEKLVPLATETRAQTFAVDASDPAAVAHLFDDVDTRLGEPDVVLYNAATAPAHGPIAELEPEAVRKAIEISGYGGFLVVQQAARRMAPHGRGAILLTAPAPASKVSTLCSLRDGQICVARSGPEHSA
jgi:NAD(P)-dependent dehydrogenase (short-subunit alcohol dehydrogenase family)